MIKKDGAGNLPDAAFSASGTSAAIRTTMHEKR